MSFKSGPLVSVVAPVYNGGEYLAQCIESVLAQSYETWECIIVDNCSTDDSLQIATVYARQDPRVVVLSNQKHLEAVLNWNYATSRMSPESRYCKVLHADDYLFPAYLEKTVELAENNPSVSVVGCLVLVAIKKESELIREVVVNREMPFSGPVIAGKKVGREFLLGERLLTCTPSSLLIRWNSARRARPLYDESTGILSALDRQVFLELLEEADYGFVPEVLTCAREHDESMTSTVYGHGVSYVERLRLLQRFQNSYLGEGEYDRSWSRLMSSYYQFLGRNVFLARGRDFWRFHRKQMRELNCSLSLLKLSTHAVWEALKNLGGPLNGAERHWRRPVSPKST